MDMDGEGTCTLYKCSIIHNKKERCIRDPETCVSNRMFRASVLKMQPPASGSCIIAST